MLTTLWINKYCLVIDRTFCKGFSIANICAPDFLAGVRQTVHLPYYLYFYSAIYAVYS